MSNSQLRVAAGSKNEVAPQAPKQDLAHLLTSPGTLAQIKAALPRHMTADRMARVALTEMRKTPKLGKCDPRTFIGAVIQLSQLGLEPGGALGHAYLIPFENKREGTVDVQIIIGYRGMIDLARRSGQIASLQAVVARENDEFSVSLGLNPTLHHVPSFDSDRPMQYVYAVAVFKDGARQFEVMSRAEVEKVRDGSQGYKRALQYDKKDNPWITHFDEMAKKTVIRRLFKYLPVSIEMQRAVGLDERGDAGLSQIVDDLGAIDSTAVEIDEDAPQLLDRSGNDSAQEPQKAPSAAQKDSPTFTYAQVRACLEGAKDDDAKALARDMIRNVADAEQRKELQELAKLLAADVPQ